MVGKRDVIAVVHALDTLFRGWSILMEGNIHRV